MSFLAWTQAQAKKPDAIVLPDGRKRLIRYFQVSTTGIIPDGLDDPPGTADDWPDAPTGWTGLLLTYKQFTDEIWTKGEDTRPILKLTFEQISASGETRVGANDFTQLPDGRHQVVQKYVMFETSSYTPQVPGTTQASGLAGYYLWTEEAPDDGTLREITRTYQTAGTVSTDDESLQGGALLLKKIESFKTVPSTPSGYTPIGTPVQNPNGYPVYTYTFAKGTGLAAQYISTRQDGLREVTNISLTSKSTPVGEVIRDDYKQQDGYTVYTVTAMQAADGNSDVTTATMSFERYVPFVYPGRAKPYTETLGAVTALNVFLGPPVETLVKATVAVSYTTTATLGTISDFWNPTDWATERATWVGAYGRAASRTVPHVGYRTTTSSAVTVTGSGFDATIYGYNVYASTTATIIVTGGPADPGGQTLTLSADIEPAFTTVSGTKWFRKTLISADIPAQSALPV